MNIKEEREVMIAALERMAYRAPGDDRLLAALRQVGALEKDNDIFQDANIRLTKEFEQDRAALVRKNRALKHEIRKLHRAREQDWEAGKRWRKEFIEDHARLGKEYVALQTRIVEIETEQGELHRELARLRDQLATAREDASEMEKKAIAEGDEALALRAEVAALKASTTVVHVDESLRMSMDREIADIKARIAELEAWLPIEESPEKRDLLVTDGYSVVIGDRFRNFWNGVDSLSCAPTHFRALPEPPKRTGDGQ